jgi:hypothetical protein
VYVLDEMLIDQNDVFIAKAAGFFELSEVPF